MSERLLADLAQFDCVLILTCTAPGCGPHSPLHLPIAEAVARWGGSTSVQAVKRRSRCTCCGARGRARVELVDFPPCPMGAQWSDPAMVAAYHSYTAWLARGAAEAE